MPNIKLIREEVWPVDINKKVDTKLLTDIQKVDTKKLAVP